MKKTLLIILLLCGPITFAGNPQRNGPQIGDFYQGGVVFWVDQTKNGQHGLLADIADKGTFAWGEGGGGGVSSSCQPGNTSNGPYTGKQNTANIVYSANCGSSGAAAYACLTSTSGGYKDWYLPSEMELNYLFYQEMAVTQTSLQHGGSGFQPLQSSPGIFYWSSTEENNENAWTFNFGNQIAELFGANPQTTQLKTSTNHVRCIRAF